MQPPNLWVPPNRPTHPSVFSSKAWILGQLGITVIAGSMFVIALTTYNDNLLLNPVQHKHQTNLFAWIVWFGWIMALAITQHRLLVKAGFNVEHWMPATVVYALIIVLGVWMLEAQPSWNTVTLILHWGFWFGISIAQALVLWRAHRRLATYWIVAGFGSSMIGIIIGSTALFVTVIIGGLGYIVATGSIIATHQSQD